LSKTEKEGAILVYTDGAAIPKNPGCGGAAAIILVDDDVICSAKYCGDYITNNKAELIAIELGLKQLKSRGFRSSEIKLYSDSVYALKVISGKNKAHKNKYLVHELQKRVRYFDNFRMFWIRGHGTNEWNNAADLMSKLAAYSPKYKWVEEIKLSEFNEKIGEIECQINLMNTKKKHSST